MIRSTPESLVAGSSTVRLKTRAVMATEAKAQTARGIKAS